MRVKKPTSKRMTTRLREGIKKKASAQRRKERKQSKKDVTWKSKHKKDIGIPSSFPYKDQIINEIEERKREMVERKEAMKLQREEERRRAESGAIDMEIDIDENADDNDGNDMAALLASAKQAAKEFDGEDDEINEDNMDEEELEVVEYEIDGFESNDKKGSNELDKSRKQFDKIFKAVVDAADVVLYVLDARDPESTRSKKVEEAIMQSQGKRLILLLNKVDLVHDENVKQWLDFLGSSFPTIPIKGASGANNSKSFNKKLTQNATAGQLLLALKAYAHKSNLKRAITVGVIGYPNVGKSSIINALTSQHGGSSRACPVGNQAGVTRTLREVKVDNKLKILDSPGIVFPDQLKKNSRGRKEYEAKLALLSAIPEKHIDDPIYAVSVLLGKLSKSDQMANEFKQFYKLPALASVSLDEFSNKVLIHIARTQGRLGKGGIPNLHSAASIVLRDWRDGRFHGWTLPKSSKASAADEQDSVKIPSGAGSAPPPPKVEQTTIVKEWAQEFDLNSLFADVFGDNKN
ncbi:RNA-binding GTPase [Martiniozyma asiatica (nom. inval.)]|nr:RNA-binding GTPase [Martiniozyma asiatica]